MHKETNQGGCRAGVKLIRYIPCVKSFTRPADNLSCKQTGVNWCNLITVQPGSSESIHSDPQVCDKTLRIGMMNTRSLYNKTAAVTHHINEDHMDLCVFTKTWLKAQHAVERADLSLAGYTFTKSEGIASQGQWKVIGMQESSLY